jgi:hypothetical protein
MVDQTGRVRGMEGDTELSTLALWNTLVPFSCFYVRASVYQDVLRHSTQPPNYSMVPINIYSLQKACNYKLTFIAGCGKTILRYYYMHYKYILVVHINLEQFDHY